MSGNFLDPTGSMQRNMNALMERGRQVSPALFGNNPTPSLYFPENYSRLDHFVTFRALKFQSVTRTSSIQSDIPLVGNREGVAGRTLQIISLPMPAQLQTGYNARYENDKDISAVEEVIATAASNVRGDAEERGRAIGQGISNATGSARNQSIGENVSSILQGIQNQIQQLRQNPDAQVGGTSLAAAGAADLGSGLLNNAIAANLAGVARNSHKVLLFQGVARRDHTFQFSLSPKNRREAEAIQKIIEAFKYHMSPSYGLGGVPAAFRGLSEGVGLGGETTNFISGLASNAGSTSRAFFEYPDVFLIEFNNRRQLFTIGESVLSRFDVNYHPMNYPAYVRSLDTPNVASPAEIAISLTFTETDIVTKEQIKQNRR